jgi:hypothetical protein
MPHFATLPLDELIDIHRINRPIPISLISKSLFLPSTTCRSFHQGPRGKTYASGKARGFAATNSLQVPAFGAQTASFGQTALAQSPQNVVSKTI